MLNAITKCLFNKDIVLYNQHRQTAPLVENAKNRSFFCFFEVLFLWRLIPFTSKSKWKYKLMYMMLNVVNPLFIIDINWTSKWHSLYYLWCKGHPKSKFIVVQHGSYVGGIVTDIPHRYTKCDAFLCWSEYFSNVFKKYNTGKKTEFISFGNPIFNKADRIHYLYKKSDGRRVLLVVSGIKGDRLKMLSDFKNKLVALGFSVDLKEHNLQSRIFEEISGFNKISDDIYAILDRQDYDIVISDHSTCLLDAIFFKNKVLFFGPEGEIEEYTENVYQQFLVNVAPIYKEFNSSGDLFKLIDLKAQENLFTYLVSPGINDLTSINNKR